MSSRGAKEVVSRATRIKAKLQSALEEVRVLKLKDVSHQHVGHAVVEANPNSTTTGVTHFNLKIVSLKFQGQSLVKRHRMVYNALVDELQSGLHGLSIVAKAPQELEAQ